LGLLVLAIPQGIAGANAALWPRAAYERFPLPPPTWMSAFGPYNEHLVRDLGMAALALAAALLYAAITVERRTIAFALGVWLVSAVPPLASPLTTLATFSAVENAIGVGQLVVAVVLPFVLLALLRDGTHGSPAPAHR